MINDARVTELAIDDILPNRFQPRIKFNEEKLNELAASIKEHGVISPIVVRKLGDKYEIIAGERRYKASILANKTTIPAIITNLDNQKSAEVALIENVQRQDLTPIEEAISYQRLLEGGDMTQSQLAAKLGKKQSTIANKLRLLNLDESVQNALLEQQISERHARSLLRLTDSKQQKELLSRIIKERLTVRKTDEVINNLLSTSTTLEKSEPKQTESTQSVLEKKETNPYDSLEMLEVNKIEKENGETMNNTQISSQPLSDSPVESMVDEIIIDDIEPTKAMEVRANDVKPIVGQNLPMDEIEAIEIEDAENTFSSASSFSQTPFSAIDNSGPIEVKEAVPEAKIPTNMPGFMDVDKIQNTAQDIYQEKPLADMDTLLKPSNSASSSQVGATNETPAVSSQLEKQPISEGETVQSITPENPMPKPKAGKFFNFFSPREDSKKATTNEGFISNLEDHQTNMEFGANQTKSDSPNAFHFDQLFNPMQKKAMDTPTPSSVNPFGTNPKNPFTASSNNLEPLTSYQAPIRDESSMPEPILEPSVKVVQSIPKAQNNFALDPDIELPIPDLMASQKQGPTVDMRTIINLIRDCSKQIEKFGYKIDTEEVDFEDSYQVTFKIDKE